MDSDLFGLSDEERYRLFMQFREEGPYRDAIKQMSHDGKIGSELVVVRNAGVALGIRKLGSRLGVIEKMCGELWALEMGRVLYVPCEKLSPLFGFFFRSKTEADTFHMRYVAPGMLRDLDPRNDPTTWQCTLRPGASRTFKGVDIEAGGGSLTFTSGGTNLFEDGEYVIDRVHWSRMRHWLNYWLPRE